jgi:hypothetical protein
MPAGYDVRRLTLPSEGEDLCSAGSMGTPANRVYLDSPADAERAGYRLARNCLQSGGRRKSLMRTIPTLWSPSPAYFTAACSSSSRRR